MGVTVECGKPAMPRDKLGSNMGLAWKAAKDAMPEYRITEIGSSGQTMRKYTGLQYWARKIAGKPVWREVPW